uniref:Uncharacterized protein LOC104265996 n=1 Tax=Phallusia mammillata TaxID=59560 RepID=A0A6F9DI88_9ASCI|nr:uncharacterized protein LOC104265996 [Phallusia mammillata]
MMDIRHPDGIVDGGEIETLGITQWFESTEDVYTAIRKFEKETGTKFIKLFRHKYDLFKSRIRWDENTRIPYVITASGKLECQFGKDRDKLRKEERKQKSLNNMMLGLEPNRKRPPMSRRSKKKNCEATISISEVLKFPQYEIDSFGKSKRSATSKLLREVIVNETDTLVQEYGCCVVFPSNEAHSGHAVGVNQWQVQLDERIMHKLNELVSLGVCSVKELKKQLRTFVFEELFKGRDAPLAADRRFFPTAKDIRDYFQKTLSEIPLDENDSTLLEDSADHCELWCNQISDVLDQIETSLEEVQSDEVLWKIKDRLHVVLRDLSKSRHSAEAASLLETLPVAMKRKFPDSVFDQLATKRFKTQQTAEDPQTITHVEITQYP